MVTRYVRAWFVVIALLLGALFSPYPSGPGADWKPGSGPSSFFTLLALDPETRIRAVEAEIVQSLTEIGVLFSGDGTVIARAPEFEEHLLVAEIDPDLVARERDRNPLIRDERPDLVQSHLGRRTGLVPRPDLAGERS